MTALLASSAFLAGMVVTSLVFLWDKRIKKTKESKIWVLFLPRGDIIRCPKSFHNPTTCEQFGEVSVHRYISGVEPWTR